MPTARHQAPASAASCGRTTYGRKGLLAFLFNLRFLRRYFSASALYRPIFVLYFFLKLISGAVARLGASTVVKQINRKTDRSLSRRPRGAPTGRVPRRGPPFREDYGRSSWCSKPKALIDGQPFPTDVLF